VRKGCAFPLREATHRPPLRRAERVDSLEAGRLIVLDTEDYREIPYSFAMNHCVMTVKRGRVIYSRQQSVVSGPLSVVSRQFSVTLCYK
jgi:hypothetical protein